jgi:predicted PurR-regulated permease PerM
MILPSPPSGKLSLRQRQTLLWTLVGLTLLVLILSLGPVLTPFFAAAILAYVLAPGVTWLESKRLPRLAAVIVMMLLCLLVLLALVLVILPILQQEIAQLRPRLPTLFTSVSEQLLPWLEKTLNIRIKLDSASWKDWLTKHLASSGDDWAAALFSTLKSGWGSALTLIGVIFLMPVGLFFFLLDWPKFMQSLRDLLPPRWQEQVLEVLDEVDHLLGQYLRGQIKVMLVLALYYSLALFAAGFKLWLPIGVLTGILIAIPYIGFALGLSFALIDGMLQLGPLQGLVLVAVIYGIGQVLEGFFLTPRLVGEQIGLHPLAVIIALLAFGFVFGLTGVLLALPLSAILAVALRRLRRAYLASEFYTGSD